jgi:hypothetical protein
MFTQAMKCDVCNHIEVVETGYAILVDDMTVPPGWLRLYANRPRRWNWDSRGLRSNIEQAYDCCSTSCAFSAIQEHNDNMNHQAEAADAAAAVASE